MTSVFQSEHLVALRQERDGVAEQGDEKSLGLGEVKFAYRETIEQERELLDLGRQMAERESHLVATEILDKAIADGDLFELQEQMVRYACSSRALVMVEGAAGAGKSRSLGVARAAWEAMGYRVLGYPSGPAHLP